MPQYLHPTSHAGRVIFLSRSLATGTMDRAAGRLYVSQATLDSITALIGPYQAALSVLPSAKGQRSKEVREARGRMAALRLHVRDMWEVLRRRTRRMGHPAEVLMLYGLPADGKVPNPTTHGSWLLCAEACVQGDAEAVAAGYPPMANPTAAEVASVLADARAEKDDVAEADRVLDLALADLEVLAPQADALITDVMDELRFNTRRMSYPSQRRIQRGYGARFRPVRGEEPETDTDEADGEP
jgi:hypothetical protein